MMSNRSEATHPGPPAIASSFTLYAASISPSMVTSRLTYFPARRTPPKFCAAPREVLLECTSANSNFGCWQIATPAAHKPTTTIFFIIPSNVLLIRRGRSIRSITRNSTGALGRLQLGPQLFRQRHHEARTSRLAGDCLAPFGRRSLGRELRSVLHACRHLYSIDH